MSSTPTVSVVTIAYNQEKYIAQALDSFVSQKTSFSFEVIVGDDCSNDNTPRIIAEYAKKYPDIIKPILRQQNIGAVPNFIDILQAAKGKYIALCEGDDYWTDPTKLQQQVDFLDSHPDFAICFHPVKVVTEGQRQTSVYPVKTQIAKLTIKALLESNFIQTNSAMYRRQSYISLPDKILPFDWYLHLFHAQFGKIGYIDKVMAVYRKHPSGLWWDSGHNIDQLWLKHGVAHMALYAEMWKLFAKNSSYKAVIIDHIQTLVQTFARVDTEQHSNLVADALQKSPEVIAPLVKTIMSSNQDYQQTINGLQSSLERSQHQVRQLSDQLRYLKNSRFWRLRNKLAKITKKPVID